jgi:uncharacterized protein (TIGR03066 family)
MSKSTKSNKQMRRAEQTPLPAKTAGGNARRWVFLGLGLVLAAGASWAVMEFVVWNKLPSELVGKWEVVQGPPKYKEAVFEFYRSGKMVGHLNDNGNLRIMKADVRVEGDKLHITTRRPSTGEEHVSVQTIRTLNDKELVVADEREIVKMVRMP